MIKLISAELEISLTWSLSKPKPPQLYIILQVGWSCPMPQLLPLLSPPQISSINIWKQSFDFFDRRNTIVIDRHTIHCKPGQESILLLWMTSRYPIAKSSYTSSGKVASDNSEYPQHWKWITGHLSKRSQKPLWTSYNNLQLQQLEFRFKYKGGKTQLKICVLL